MSKLEKASKTLKSSKITNEEVGIKTRSISFTLKPEERIPITEWLKEVQAFFGIRTAVTNSLLNLYQKDDDDNELITKLDNIEIDVPQPIYYTYLDYQQNQIFDDMIEGLTVKFAIHLIANLSHYSEIIRVQASQYILQLTSIFNPNILSDNKKTFENIILNIQINNDIYKAVSEFFEFIGESLSRVSLALVSGLECFYTYIDPLVRGICISALTQIINKNEKIFIKDDNMLSFWNLKFSLGAFTKVSNSYPDRICSIHALNILSKLYINDLKLTLNIIQELMKLEKKSKNEIKEIQNTLIKIFTDIHESVKDDKLKIEATYNSVYESFKDIIVSNNEDFLDLLSWAIINFTKITNNKKKIVKESPSLQNFISSLSFQFSAVQPLVRYGAVVCLYATLDIFPRLLLINPELMILIVNGLTDNDYYCSSLYRHIFEEHTENHINITKLIEEYQKLDFNKLDYDFDTRKELIDNQDKIINNDIYTENLLKMGIEISPNIHKNQLLKYANVLEFVSTKECIKFLYLIKYWGQKEKRIDIYIIQALISLLVNGELEIQNKTLDVLLSLIPLFIHTNDKELLFIWTHLRNILVNHQNKDNMILVLIKSLIQFPFDRLPDESLKDLLKIQFTLIFHKNPNIREAVYKFLDYSYNIWKNQELKFQTMSILYSSIGDAKEKNAILVLNIIIKLSYNSVLQELIPNLKDIKSALEKNNNEELILQYPFYILNLKNIINKSNAIQINQNNYQDLINILFEDFMTDKFWEYFLENCSDGQLVKPDEFNYSRFFIQTPFFISILYSKFNIPPPALNDISNNTPRNVMPTSVIGKRRFILGYILCNMPLTGISDKTFRKMACITLIRCCFRQIVLKHKVLFRLMEYVKEKMLVSKYWIFKLSGIDIIKYLILIKLPLIGQCMMAQFLDYTLDILHNSPIDSLKQGALLLIEASTLIYPKAIGLRLSDIRDAVRLMFIDDNTYTTELASRIYDIVFSIVPENQIDEFYKYLINEISLITKKGLEAMSDPLISNLNIEESERIIIYSLSALGSIKSKLLSGPIIRELLKYITSENYKIRKVALKSIFIQVDNLNSIEKLTILWIVLPLFADENYSVRKTFNLYLKNVLFSSEILQNEITPHKEDSPSLTSKTFESILKESDTTLLTQKEINEIGNDVEKIYIKYYKRQTIEEMEIQESLTLPPISMDYIPFLKAAAKKICGRVSNQKIGEIIYFLLSFIQSKPLKFASYLVLSEFCCYHDESIIQISKVLSDLLYQEICLENRKLIEVSIISLYNLSEFLPTAFRQVLNTITASNEKCDGEIYAIHSLIPLIKENLPIVAPELLNSYLPIITNKRQPLQKRINAVVICAELATICSDAESNSVMKAILSFINSFQNNNEKMKIFASLESIFKYFKLNSEFGLFLIDNARASLMNSDSNIRNYSIPTFNNLHTSLKDDDFLWFIFHYLADPVETISERGKMILCDDKYFTKYNLSSVTYIDEKVKSTKQFLDIIKEEINEEEDDDNIEITPFEYEDIYNCDYYNSNARKKISEMYGLSESLFKYKCRKLKKTPLNNFDSIVFVEHQEKENDNNKNIDELNKLNCISILHHLMKQLPDTTSSIINELFDYIDNIIGYNTANTFNGNEVAFYFSVLENLIRASDGINDELTNEYMKKLQTLINNLLKRADDIRKYLFQKIEKSLFFFSDYIDIPIVSSEQYNLIEEIKKESQEATLEIMKTGKATKLNKFENTKNEFNSIIENENEELRKSVTISMFALALYGSYYTFSNDCKMNDLILGYRFLYNILKDKHRGVRSLVTDILISITKNHYKIKNEFTNEAVVTIKNLIKIIRKEDSSLYYRKIDILNLICNLSCIINDKSIQHETIKILLDHWRDLNDEIRIVSINLIKYMGEYGVNEILNGLAIEEKSDNKNALNIMVEIASLMSNPEYTEKAELNDLLNWYFDKVKEMKQKINN
ncbi:hypothetical protein BCR32DRAFT_289679 [Anaeromyces robustus]|uniref:ARM repeat-containing protein n=1 Tax=Anaeromyces robustus TaxID=1754192 RepID=A0A1Y1XMD0_9FUNG|nr:hypothetical protein BCR32DRAFT_289679 [Anaeromyces robustus]|eukprot:ORX86881.1 hypothetical protein BCR32DRAFT_289679 [Anaeromyces robustus]